MHITVDYSLCEGHGQCLLAAPEVFDLPDGSEQERITDSSFEIISSKETPIPQVLKNQLYGGSAGCNTASSG